MRYYTNKKILSSVAVITVLILITLLSGLFVHISEGYTTHKELKTLREPVSSDTPSLSDSERITPKSKRKVVVLIHKWANYYDYPFHKAYALADIESDFDPEAENPNSSATGIYQFIKMTWENYCEGDVKNPDDNIKCGIKLLAAGDTHHWEADPSVPKKLKKKYNITL